MKLPGPGPRCLTLFVIAWLMCGLGAQIGLARQVASPAALDDEMLHALSILAYPPADLPQVTATGTLGRTIGVPPGSAIALVPGVIDYEVCGIGIRCFVPVPVSVSWSVTPDDGAVMDPATGVLTIDPAATGGSRFTVRAELDGGRHVISTEVYVVTLESNPFVGYWYEETQFACGLGTELAPALPIEELVFAADGAFAVTWTPFESYVDYWGTYRFDLAGGTLDLAVTGGNAPPTGFDGHGRFTFDESGRLVLTDIWLGNARSSDVPPHCGHRFGFLG